MTTDISATLPQSPEYATHDSSAAPENGNSHGNSLAEKRREPRYAICEPVEVYLLDMNNLRLRGMLKDVSKSGMRIELDMPLKAGDRLEILLQNKAIVFAEVRHCHRTGESYQVGTVIDDVYYPKAATSPRTSKTAGSETTSKQVTQRISFAEKRPENSQEGRDLGHTSEGVFDQVLRFRHPVRSECLGSHIDRNDIDNLLDLRLSVTKAAILERHLASCEQCVDLVQVALEERASPPFGSSRNTRGRI